MSSWTEITRLVEERAGGRCEYCGMHQALQGATFHVEHTTPRSRGGKSDLANLAWCCPRATYTSPIESMRWIPVAVSASPSSTPVGTIGRSIFGGKVITWLGKRPLAEPRCSCSS
jgi:hypothetical protein